MLKKRRRPQKPNLGMPFPAPLLPVSSVQGEAHLLTLEGEVHLLTLEGEVHLLTLEGEAHIIVQGEAHITVQGEAHIIVQGEAHLLTLEGEASVVDALRRTLRNLIEWKVFQRCHRRGRWKTRRRLQKAQQREEKLKLRKGFLQRLWDWVVPTLTATISLIATNLSWFITHITHFGWGQSDKKAEPQPRYKWLMPRRGALIYTPAPIHLLKIECETSPFIVEGTVVMTAPAPVSLPPTPVMCMECAPQPHVAMTIFVKTLTGKTTTLNVNLFDSVLSLKSKLMAKEGFQISEQRLAFAGKQLENRYSLYHYNIQHFSTLDLNLKLCGGMEPGKKKRKHNEGIGSKVLTENKKKRLQMKATDLLILPEPSTLQDSAIEKIVSKHATHCSHQCGKTFLERGCFMDIFRKVLYTHFFSYTNFF